MRFSASCEALTSATITAARLVNANNPIPILTTLLVEASEGRASVTGTDLDLVVRSEFAADVSEKGSAAIRAAPFAESVRAIDKAASVSIDATEKADAILRSGRSRLKIRCLDAVDWPKFEADATVASFKIKADLLARALGAAVATVCKTVGVRVAYEGVTLYAHEGCLVVASTDGHRATRYFLADVDAPAGMQSIILPTRACEAIISLCKAGGNVLFEIGSRLARVEAADSKIVARMIDAKPADYEWLIARTTPPLCARFDRSDLVAALRRLAPFIEGQTKLVRFTLREETLKISCRAADEGEGEAETETDYDGAAIDIGLNGRYAADAVETLAGDRAELRFSDAGSPCKLLDPSEPALTILVMPQRL